MNLLIDLGNTRVKWTCTGGAQWRPGQAAELATAALDGAWSGLPRPDRVIGASVASAARRDEVHAWIQRRWGRRAVWVEAQSQFLGVSNRYRRPTQLGADRWAALIAARAAIGGAVCVVDCGTAVTIDALSADGQFCGGVILPGLGLARRSLVQGTAAIGDEEGDARSCLACSTADGVAAGTLFGVVGGIERVLAEQGRALGVAPEVIVTGGDVDALVPHLSMPVRVDTDLVLKGLALIAEATP